LKLHIFDAERLGGIVHNWAKQMVLCGPKHEMQIVKQNRLRGKRCSSCK
jgi:hypothetical protein